MAESIAGVEALTYHFCGFVLDPGTRMLSRDGEPVVLQPKVFDLILFLLLNRDRAVSKDELQDAVWSRQVITETAMTRAIMKARKALDDDANQPSIISTLHAHGYRFIAPVDAVAEAGDSESSAVSASSGESVVRRPLRGWPWLPISLFLLVGTISMLWLWRQELSEKPLLNDNERARIALLPIENGSGDTRFDWTRLGLIAGVVDYLETNREADTVALPSIIRLIESQDPPMATDQNLTDLVQRLAVTDGATHVVASIIEADAGQLRLRYRLVDRHGTVRHRTLVASTPTGLMLGLAADLTAQFSEGRQSRQVPSDPFANEAYLRGKSAFLSGDYDAAITLLNSALSEAPGALWPRLELAMIARNRRQFDDSEARFLSLIEDARRSGDAAVEFSATNSLGNLYLMSERIELAEARWAQAVDLAERRDEPFWMAKAYHNMAIAASINKNKAKSREWLQKASDAFTQAGFETIPPNLAMKIGDQYHEDGELDTAEHYVQQAIHGFRTLGVTNAEAAAVSSMAYIRKDRGWLEESVALLSQAIQMLRRSQNQEREIGSLLAQLGRIRGFIGDFDAADADFAEAQTLLEPLDERIPLGSLELMRAQNQLRRGEPETAIADLDAALDHYREGRLPYGEALTLAYMAKMSAALGRGEEAEIRAAQALEAADASHSPEAQFEARDAKARAHLLTIDLREAGEQWNVLLQECPQIMPGRPYMCARMQLDAAMEMTRLGQREIAARWIASVKQQMPTAPGLEQAESLLTSDNSSVIEAPVSGN